MQKAEAFTVAQINSARFKFADTTASTITMTVGGTTRNFKRITTPPEQTISGGIVPIAPTYIFELQGTADDGCREGNPATGAGGLAAGVTTTVSKVSITNANLDATPPPANISGSLLFFHKDSANNCVASGVDSSIQVANSFGPNLKVPAAEKAIAGAGATEPADNCEASDSGPLGWILCPIIGIASNFTNFVFVEFVKPFLEDVPISTNPNDGSYKAWQQFRLIGNIVLVGAMLAVVYAQVKGN